MLLHVQEVLTYSHSYYKMGEDSTWTYSILQTTFLYCCHIRPSFCLYLFALWAVFSICLMVCLSICLFACFLSCQFLRPYGQFVLLFVNFFAPMDNLSLFYIYNIFICSHSIYQRIASKSQIWFIFWSALLVKGMVWDGIHVRW